MQTVLRLYYIMMDPAADALLTASIGRSPRSAGAPGMILTHPGLTKLTFMD